MAAGRHRHCHQAHCHKRAAKRLLADYHTVDSLYCEDHTCRADLGDRTCRQPSDIQNDRRYCLDHELVVCSDTKCNTIALERPGVARLVGQVVYCNIHRCISSGCPSQAMEQHRYCRQHLPRNCQFNGCRRATSASNHRFCPEHECSLPNCVRQCYRNGLCYAHRTCLIPGCGRPPMSLPSGQGLADHCKEHAPCAVGSCSHFAIPSKSFCSRHACIINACSGQRKPGCETCTGHTCRVDTCFGVIVDVSNSNSRFCVYHKCSTVGCFGPAQIGAGSALCSRHRCAVTGCQNPPKNPGSDISQPRSIYCTAHECAQTGCSAEAEVSRGYCRLNGHGCTQHGCPRAKAHLPGFPGLCDEHSIAAAQDRGAREALQREQRDRQLREERDRQRREQEDEELRVQELTQRLRQQRHRRLWAHRRHVRWEDDQ